MAYWKPGKKKNSALKRDTERHRNQKAAYRNVQQQMRKAVQNGYDIENQKLANGA